METTAATALEEPAEKPVKPLNSGQIKVYNECPAIYRATFAKAYSGDSRSAAIKAFCLRCVGYLRNEVRDCTSKGCPLWPYRPYQDGSEE